MAPFDLAAPGRAAFTVRAPATDKMPKRTYTQYSADTKHFILQQYTPGVYGSGFAALASQYGVPNGARTVQSWYSKWDGTPQSLQKQTTSHKRRTLDPHQVKQHIRQYVIDMNSEKEHVKYENVKKNVEQETDAPIAWSTLKRYGYKEALVSCKRTTRTLTSEGMLTC